MVNRSVVAIGYLLAGAVSFSSCTRAGGDCGIRVKPPRSEQTSPKSDACRSTEPLAGLNAYVQKAIKRWQIPGLAVAVVKDGQIVHLRGYGVRKLGGNASVDPHTVFSIASCSKAFGAASIALLVDEGKLRWDDKVVKHLPAFRLYNDYVTRETTIRDLLSHRVGVQAADLLHRRGDIGPKQIREHLRFLQPVAGFRAGMTYSNLLYAVTGQIVAKVTGKPWGEFVAQRIFSPLGMSRTSASRPKETQEANLATQHWMTRNGIQRYVMGGRFQNFAPSGAVHASAADMACWVTMLLSDGSFNKQKLLTPARIHEMHSMQIPMPTARSKSVYAAEFLGYGLGWNVLEYRGRKLIHHAGSSVAMVALMPEEQLGIVILTNLEYSVLAYMLMHDILDAHLVGPEAAWSTKKWPSWLDPDDEYKQECQALKKLQSIRKRGTKPTLPLAAYAGKYRCNLFGKVRVVLCDKTLQLRFGPGLTADLTHWHHNTFLTEWHAPFERLLLDFETSPQRAVTGFRARCIASDEPTPRFTRIGLANASWRRARDELERSVAAMARIGGCWSPSFSPDGRRIAFCSNLNGRPQVWIVSSEGGWPQLVTATDDPINKVLWSPKRSWLALELAPGGGENPHVYVVRPDGTEMRRLTKGKGRTNWLGVWTMDGNQIAVASNRRDVAKMENYLVNVPSGEARRFEGSAGICRTTSFSRDGRLALVWRLRRRGDGDLYLVGTKTGQKTHLTPHKGQQRSYGYLSPDGRNVFLATDAGRDKVAFGRIVIDENGRPGRVEFLQSRDDAELESWAINADGTKAALIWSIAGQSELAMIDLATGKSIPVPKPPRAVAYQPVFSRDGSQLAMVCSGPASPRDIWVLDIKARRFRQITHSPHAGVDLPKLVRPRLVRFRSHDGLELTGWLYLPTKWTAPGPLVLDFHGGPEAMHWPIMTPLFQALAANGIAVFAPNVRGSAGFGKRFMSLDDGPQRSNAVKDIKTCVDYVVSKRIAHPRRIGITGLSYGGYMTMAGLTEFPDLFAAGVMRSGIVNFQTLLENCDPWHAAISKIEYGDPKTQSDLLHRLSPIHKIDRVRAPTLVIHGANDTNCPIAEAEQAVTGLQKNGVKVKYLLIPGEGHILRNKSNVVRVHVAIVRWFVEHLKAPAN